jgi:hypothetical protein
MYNITEPEVIIRRYRTLANPGGNINIPIEMEQCKSDNSITNERLRSNIGSFLCVKNISQLVVQGQSSYRSATYPDIIQRI